MIYRLVQLANPRRAGHQLCEVGLRINPQELAGTEQWTLTRPDGTTGSPRDVLATEATTGTPLAENQSNSGEAASSTVTLDEPGRWILTGDAGNGPKSISLLVTVAASESRTDPLPGGQLQALGMSPAVASVKDAAAKEPDSAVTAQLDAGELESQQKFWRWILLAGLGFLALEAIVSSVLERRQQIELV